MTGKVFDLLLVFAKNPGRLIEKTELIDRLWPDEFVEEGNLSRNVSTLRKALGDAGKTHRYIDTVQGHGYKFVADVTVVDQAGIKSLSQPVSDTSSTDIQPVSRKWFWILAVVVLFTGAGWIIKTRVLTGADRVRSVAVLPLRSLDSEDPYLGIGIADAVIRRLTQTGQVAVRPTSAVFRFIHEDTDALAAARQLNADAVLEGTIQRADDRLSVSLNLLRTGDGASLWTDSLVVRANDVFMVEDVVSQQVIKRLQIKLDQSQQAALSKNYTSSPTAYDFYVKGIYSLDQRGYGADAKPQMQATIELLKRAIEVDPGFALAHAKLGYAYTWTALFIEPTDPKWAALARDEIDRAEKMDADLAEPHQARALLLWSAFEGFQTEAAVRELLRAQQLDPSAGHTDLAAIYGHMGLDGAAARELKQSFEVDPLSENNNDLLLILPYLRADPDEWRLVKQQVNHTDRTTVWYNLRKGHLTEAKAELDKPPTAADGDPGQMLALGLYFALSGDVKNSRSAIEGVEAKLEPNNQSYHHMTYDLACINALNGNPNEAVKWLGVTFDSGFPNYPLLERDPFLAGIRNDPTFIQFMANKHNVWQAIKEEFDR